MPTAPIFNLNELTQRTLPNGVRVVVREARGSGLVAVQLWLRAGSRLETSDTNGISHLLEHLVFRGDRADSPQQVIEDAGGQVNGETDKDATHFDAVVPAEAFEPTLRSLAAAVQRADWTPRQLDNARDTIEQELRGRLMQPFQQANDLAYRAALRTHPYRLLAGGGFETLPSLELAHLKRHHAQHYVGANLSVVIVGDVARATALAAAQAALGSTRRGESSLNRVFAAEDWTGPRELTVNLPYRLSVLTLAFRAPGMAAPMEVWAMDVLVTLLGEGRRARLRQRLIEQAKVAVEVDAQFITRHDLGLLTMTMLVEPTNLGKAQVALVEEVRSLASGEISDDEVSRARARMEGVYAAQNETAEGQAGSLGFYEALGSYEHAIRYDAQLRAVTTDRVRALAAKSLGRNTFARVLIRGFGAPRTTGPVTP